MAQDSKKPESSTNDSGLVGSGGRIRTGDLRVMSPTSYHCSTPRRGAKAATTYCPRGPPPVSSALGRCTTVFGMGTGGTTPLGSPPSTAPVRLPAEPRQPREIRGVARPNEGASGAPSALSTAQLRRLLALHLRPIHQVVYLGPYSLAGWETSSWGGLRT